MWRIRWASTICSKRDRVRAGVLAIAFVFCNSLPAPAAVSGDARSPNRNIDFDADKTPEQLGWKLDYDVDGRVTKLIDPAGRETEIQYTFDKVKRLRKVVRSNKENSVTNEFDEQGRLLSMTDSAGTVSYDHDPQGRLNKVQRKGAADIFYTYDTHNRVTRLQVGDFYKIDYTHDFLGRLESMQTPAGLITYEYLTGQGQVVRTLPNGVKTIWQYDPRGQLQRLVHADAQNIVLAGYTNQYRPDGLIAAISERSSSGQVVKSYEYDQMKRLVRVTSSDGQQQVYEYDQVSNRLKATATGKPSQTATYDWIGRVASVNGQRTGYDAAGNLTAVSLDGTTLQYGHNQDGQLVDAGSGKVTYKYDGDGQLISRKAGGTESNFIPDPFASIWRPLVIEEKGSPRTLMVWQAEAPLLTIRDGQPEYLLHDHLGSVRLVADAQGNVSQRLDYDSFGNSAALAGATDFAPRFAGLFWDPASNVYLTLARAYAPQLGKFLQIDPKQRIPNGMTKELSIYAYCANDPINSVDLDGRTPKLAPYTWAWEFSKSFVTSLPKTIGESLNSGMTFWSQAFRGGVEFGAQPGSLADQAVRFGGPSAGQTVQALSGVSLIASAGALAAAQGPTLAAGFENWVVTRGLQYGGKFSSPEMIGTYLSDPVLANPTLRILTTREWFHVPFLPNAIRNFFGNPHFGIGEFGSHLAWGSTHFYKDRVFDAVRMTYSQYFSKSGVELVRQFVRWTAPAAIELALSTRAEASNIAAGEASYSHAVGNVSARLPSTVGGVYLGGAGQSLAGLGLIDGIAQDGNGNLVLLAKGGEKIKLPPLRLDDVVTVFRSVYLDGEGPTVTIDPNPENPEGPTMIIKHSKATGGTYVGWILYEADRLMKGYTISVDNITKQSLTSSVPGFAEILDKIFFGGEGSDKRRKEGIWERFWIVPAEAGRYNAPKNELTIFDVLLKVKTQKMKWEKGKLVDDSKGESSPGALAFTKWFTKNYKLIASEQMLTPPRESGIIEPVAVFSELRRIALITAIAEKLRDQGAPMPFWMRDYEVRPVPFEKTTPALEVPRSKDNVSARIYGGVGLSAADKDVKNFDLKADLSTLSKEDAEKARAQLKLAARLEETIRSQMAGAEPLKVRALTQQGAGYQALVLPGAETLVLAPARMHEVDLVAPVGNSDPIRLMRSYNSFFSPVGPWGKGWTLDLPQLVQIQVPTHRDDNTATFQQVYELITPLNSLYARFSKIGKVVELNDSSLQVPDQPGEFYGLADARPDFLSGPTRKLIRKDGGAWHFSEAGDLVATEQAGSQVVYERDAKRQLTRIVGLLGRKLVATIDLRYSAAGRIESAKTTDGKNEVIVRYEYDQSGKLIGVVTGSGRLGYYYENALVTEVTYQAGTDKEKAMAKTLRHLQYTPQGQLLAETDTNGAKTEYKISTDPNGSKLTIVYPDKGSPSEMTQYDSAFRPVRMTTTDGSEYAWTYAPDGTVVLETKDADGRKARITEAIGERTRTVQLDGGRTFEGKFDTAGHLISLTDNKLPLLQQEWSGDGRLVRVVDETRATHFEYDRDGLPSQVLLAPPTEKGKFSRWQTTELSPNGLPTKIADSNGLEMGIDYAEGGAIKAAVIKRDGKAYGFEIGRDKEGRIQEVKSSWGKQRYYYDNDGQLSKLEIERGGQKSVTEWKAGLFQKATQFDGGEYRVAYDNKLVGLPKKVTMPNQLALTYEYANNNRLARINVGTVYDLLLDYDKNGRLTSWTYAAPKR